MALQSIAPDSVQPDHYVDWAPIFAGTVIATAIAIIMFTFGTAIGLSMASPYEGQGASKIAYLVALGLWTMWVIICSFMAGGYLAGRLRRRVGDSSEHEVEVRDGAHGLVVWALGIVFASWLLTLGVTGLLGTAAKAGAAAGSVAGSSDNDRTAFTLDSLFRNSAQDERREVGISVPGQSDSETSVASRRSSNTGGERGEARRLLMYGMVKGDLTHDNKAALVWIVADRTGLSQSDAEARVNQVLDDAKKVADTARRTALISGFLIAAALLIGGAASAWAATIGGRHRDKNTDTSGFWRWA
jgi:hypothetical protein